MNLSAESRTIRPLTHYAVPGYPTREEARVMGIDLYDLPQSAWKRYGRSTLAGAILLAMGIDTAFGAGPMILKGQMKMPPIKSIPVARRYLKEADARQIISDIFKAEGVDFEEDYEYKNDKVEFNADGFNKKKGIGFEYHSIEDLKKADSLKDEKEQLARMFLDKDELKSLAEQDKSKDADSIRVFKSGQKRNLTNEERELKDQVHEYIKWLKSNGKL